MDSVQRIAVGLALASTMFLVFSPDARRATGRMARRGSSMAKGLANRSLDMMGDMRERMM